LANFKGRFEMNLFTYDDETVPSSSTPLGDLGFDRQMKLNKTNELVLRIVDDYLIICDDEKRMDAIKHRLGGFFQGQNDFGYSLIRLCSHFFVTAVYFDCR
jgi:hypothetical protein